jgi:hypothetical protein
MMVDIDPIGFCRLGGLRGRALAQTNRGHRRGASDKMAPAQRRA